MLKPINRLIEFSKYKGLTKKSFEIEMGLSNGQLSNSERRGSDIGAELISKVEEKFPELNIHWLVTGKGNMLKDGPDQSIELRECLKKKEQLADLLVEKELEIKKLKSIYTKVPDKSKLKK